MSVIFGIYNPSGPPVAQEALDSLAQVTARYGPDETSLSVGGSLGMAYQAFRTHQRSHLERQPGLDPFGNRIVLDGRLDNYEAIADELGIKANEHSDSSLMLKAFVHWGEKCFSRFVGEWALAIWSARDRVLYLVRDHAGSRTLLFRDLGGQIMWSTYLETFCADNVPLELNKEYLARALACQAIRELTPYKGIFAVPSAHYLRIKDGKTAMRAHWTCIADSQISYRTDAEYDEHFLHLFGQAVRRRVGPGAPILAELSGGMDSTSIVCMADYIRGAQPGMGARFDTVSYYDDTEPDWDDRPYFEAVERHRGKQGFHVDVSSRGLNCEPLVLLGRRYPYLCGDSSYLDLATQFEKAIGPGDYRAILSGIGGDELLGGVPTAVPELADYFRQGRLARLLARSFVWALAGRGGVLRMLWSTIKSTIDLYWESNTDESTIPPWLSSELRRLCRQPYTRVINKRELLCSSPSAIANGRTWWGLLETLPNRTPRILGCREYRFPYLDKELVEFLHRVPRDQLVQPGRRRLLMRRALEGIVPVEVLERKRKAFVSHGPTSRLRDARKAIEEMLTAPLAGEYGLIERNKFFEMFHAELTGEIAWVSHVTRAIEVELWLKGLNALEGPYDLATFPRYHVNRVLPVENGQLGSA